MKSRLLANTTVLVVDDEESIRSMLGYELEMLGCRPLFAGDGNEALDVLGKQGADLVISDVRMPRCDGIALLGRLRERFGLKPPLVLMSGYADMPLWEAFDRGAEGWFGKPFDLAIIAKLIADLGRPAAERWTELPVRVPVERLAPPPGTAVTVGRGGAFLGYLPPVELGRNALVSFDFGLGDSDGTRLVGAGYIRWTRRSVEDGLPEGCGVEFVYLEPQSQALMAASDGQRAVAFIPKGPKGGMP